MIKAFVGKHPSTWRYISVAAILLIIFPVIFGIGYGGEIGAYIGIGIFLLLGMYGLYEVFSKMEMSKYSVVFLSLLPLILFLFTAESITPFDHFRDVAASNTHISSNNFDFAGILKGSFTWKNLLLLSLLSLMPLIADSKLRQSKNLIWNIIVIVMVTVTFSVFVKFAWIVNVFDYLWLIYFLSIAIVADTFAYLGGKYLGKYIFNGAKMAPQISPKKTWAGFIIGYIAASGFIIGLGYYLHIFESTGHEIGVLIAAGLLLPIVSPIGDLFFSAIKRSNDIKDFSNLMPGHGGILDRLDSATMVFFVLTLLFIII